MEYETMNIQWFPGHMTKAKRMIAENIKLVDAVCEIVDARIPYSSRNPDVGEMTSNKPRLLILNRADQADPEITKTWAKHFKSEGFAVLETDSQSGKGVDGLQSAIRFLLKDKIARYAERGQSGRKLRLMIVGIPNVGKSSFINRVAKRKAAAASDRPGVTRGKQWITIGNGFELLDTPGVLWPRFENQIVAENLAFTGAIRDEILDIETLASNLLLRLKVLYPQRLIERYKIDLSGEPTGFALLEQAARKRGFLISGGECDTNRMAVILLDEFRGGKLGRISLEKLVDLETLGD
jgi:ribosome biogenesis GTPase A